MRSNRKPIIPKIHISCVVDDSPKFRLQAWNWLLSLQSVDTRCKVFVHYTAGALSDDIQSKFAALGATLVQIEPYGTGPAAYCNKIRQIESDAFLDADFVILSDADIGFLEDPAKLVMSDTFRAKLVDVDNPPEKSWSKLADQMGLADVLDRADIVMQPGRATFATNFNGGLYVMPTEIARNLAPLWRKYADACLSQTDVLGPALVHSDQLGMGFAVATSRSPVALLNAGDNLPTHLSKGQLDLLEPHQVTALHYHNHLDPHGLPRRTDVAWIDAAVNRLNTALTSARRNGFINELFWDYRYTHFPELGSGLGSRGEILAHKQSLLRPYMAQIGTGSVLDVGCGDLEVYADLPVVNYTGLDHAEAALNTARAKRPDWTFLSQDISACADESADYTSCIDVFIHQPTEDAARKLAVDLVRTARKGVFFSVHSEVIEGTGISFNSEGIRSFIADMPDISAVERIGTYRDVALYFAEKGLGERKSVHDIGLQEMVVGHQYSEDSAALSQLIDYSRAQLGFFPRTIIRSHEYPWFARQMAEVSGQSILDIGAGVCCLPLLLAERGAQVTTVDRHGLIRNGTPKSKWNEWGYLDYSALDGRIQSFNTDASQFDQGMVYDVIYSVSVIEHMPADVRRAVMKQIEKLLAPDGTIFLSLDLDPGTNDLWNLNEGQIVDPEGHGTLDDFKTELAELGLLPDDLSYIRAMPGSRTDVAYMILRRAPRSTQAREGRSVWSRVLSRLKGDRS